MKWILNYLSPLRRRITVGTSIKVFGTLAELMIPFLLSYILAKRFTKPIMSIQNSAKDFAKGNFNSRVDEIATKSDITEIAELADAFNNMANELEKVEDVRTSFISDVSHELRTPMTTIGGFVNGMLDDTIPYLLSISFIFDSVKFS